VLRGAVATKDRHAGAQCMDQTMSTTELRVMYEPDDDWCGEIIATARSGAFAGQGSAWFSPDHIKQTFVAGLRSYPLSVENPPLLEGGYGSVKGRFDQGHVRITVKPYNTRGTLLVHAELASRFWKTPDADLQNSATIRFLTEYAAVDHFAAEFEELLHGKREFAILHGATR